MAILAGHLPLPLIESSHFLASLCGMVLLPLAMGLRRRLDAAWALAGPVLLAGAILSLLKGLDWEEALLLTVTAALLLTARAAFYRRSRLLDQRFSPGWLLSMVAVFLSVTWLGLFAYRHVDYGPELWWQFVAEADAPRFLRATAGCFVVLLVLAVRQLASYARPLEDDRLPATGGPRRRGRGHRRCRRAAVGCLGGPARRQAAAVQRKPALVRDVRRPGPQLDRARRARGPAQRAPGADVAFSRDGRSLGRLGRVLRGAGAVDARPGRARADASRSSASRASCRSPISR